MECQEIRQLLSSYMDGQLEKSQHEHISSHLQECAGCRAELEELQKAVGFLRQLPDLSPPPEFRAQLRRRIAAESNNKPAAARKLTAFAGGRLARFAAAAALICLAIGLAALWQGFTMPWDKSELVQRVQPKDTAADSMPFSALSDSLSPTDNNKDYGKQENGPLKESSLKESGAQQGGRPDQGRENLDIAALPEKQREANGSFGSDQKVDIMAAPPASSKDDAAEDAAGRQQEEHFSREQKQEISIMMGDPKKESIDYSAPKTIHVTELTLQTEDLDSAKQKITAIVEKYNGEFIEAKPDSIMIKFSALDSDTSSENAVAEITKAANLLTWYQEDQNVNENYNNICSELAQLYAEEQQLSVKGNLTSVEKELLIKTRDKVKEYEKQLQQFDSILNENIVKINLKLHER